MSERLALHGGPPALAGAKLPQWPPRYASTERELVELYRNGYWSFNGPREQAFCGKFAAYHGARNCVFMMNGTVTLEAALYALGIGPGDEVLVPAVTWVATAAAVLYNGGVPVFVDVDPGTICLDTCAAEAAITSRTRAVIPVHLYGSMVDMDALMALADRHGLVVVEDCAHGAGAFWGDRGVGTLGHIGSFSFQESKTLACGEGGAILTDDDALASQLYRYKHIGYPPGPRPHLAPGERFSATGFVCHNYRATEFQSAILLGQMRTLRRNTVRRGEGAGYLRRELTKVPGVSVQAPGRRANPQSYYTLPMVLDLEAFAGLDAHAVMTALAAEGLTVKPPYGTVYRHPLWNVSSSEYVLHASGRDSLGECCAVAEDLMPRTLCLPHPWLVQPRSVLARVVDAVAKVQRLAGTVRVQ